MRVIAGKFRSRPLLAPAGSETRPTSDRLRETLFNILTQGSVDRVGGASFLDLYAGSGAVGIEAASRGAAAVTFVEENAAAIATLRNNLDSLGLRGANFQVARRSVAQFLRSQPQKPTPQTFSVVFLDPPYDLAAEYTLTLGLLGGECATALSPGAMVVAEHRRKTELAANYGMLSRVRVLLQGDAAVSFYQLG